MGYANSERDARILLVEDNPGDIRLVKEALNEAGFSNSLSVIDDGTSVIPFLHRKSQYSGALRPDIIILDLNIPKRSGLELLAEIKSDENLKRIPVIVITTSNAEHDILNSYNLHANCYIRKPLDFERFVEIVKAIGDFWFRIVILPPE